MTIITKGMGAILKGVKKSWKDKRVSAMNRKIKKSVGKSGTTEHYIDEYSAVSRSKAPSKRIYKSVQKKWNRLTPDQQSKIWMKRSKRGKK